MPRVLSFVGLSALSDQADESCILSTNNDAVPYQMKEREGVSVTALARGKCSTWNSKARFREGMYRSISK